MSELIIGPDARVGTLAEGLPGATEVFRRADIGFCCGGNETLAVAAANRGADLGALIGELQALCARAANQPPNETLPLIDHILTRFHEVHREELEWLIPLARKVETVHGDNDAAPLGLTAALVALADELERHMLREEQVLFPMMRAGANPQIAHPIAVMRHEHDTADELLARVLETTGHLALPDGACRSWASLYNGLRKFADDLTAHIRLENDVLFPRYEPV